MSGVYLSGLGAVSPAGWNLAALRDALAREQLLPATELPVPARPRPLQAMRVPPANPRPAFLAHSRLRRTSPITQYAVGAALEALGPRDPATTRNIGVIVCVFSGCVNYSRRFYDEALKDPATASPLVFPETVFNAPASHISAYLGSNPGTNYLGTILAHEMGHCIGFRHTDYMNRSFSCGGSAVNEGASTVGAVLIPGTPSGPVSGSWMLACIGSGQNRPFNSSDIVALNYLY